VEQVRFMNSGSEAVALALTMARAITGRYKVLMARYGFHGQHEAFNDGLFRGKMPPWPDTYVATFGDADEFEQVLTDHGDEIAAVFLEPVMAAAGLVSAPAEFFHRVQRAADAAGALFVLDEASVFRLATGGMQEGLGVTPDLTVLGKMVGGGFPVGAVGGRRDVMAVLDPRAGILASSSTFAGNPVAMAAGVVAVRDLDADAIFRLEGISQQLDEAITARAAAAGLPFSLRRVGSLINVYFSPEPPEANQVRTDHDLMTRFHLAALNRGVFMVPRGLVNPSTAVTSDDLGIAIDRLGDAIDDVAADVANGAPPITV
jgi:glutamate-1-semialdehyde 2,1-aminomutase